MIVCRKNLTSRPGRPAFPPARFEIYQKVFVSKRATAPAPPLLFAETTSLLAVQKGQAKASRVIDRIRSS